MTSGLDVSNVSEARLRRRWPARLAAAAFLLGMVGFMSYWVRGIEPDPLAVILYGLSILPSGLVLAFDVDGEAIELGGRDRRRPLDRRRTFGRRVGAMLIAFSALIVMVGAGLVVGVLPFGTE